MINKKLAFLIVFIILVLGLVLQNVLSNQKQPMRRNNASAIPPVKVLTVENTDIVSQFEIGGHLTAFNNVDIYAEVSGILIETPKRFKPGTRFKKGDVLIKIDDSVYKNQVLAQKSSLLNQLTLLLPDLSIDYPGNIGEWEKYLHDFKLDKPLAPLPEPSSDQERYYIASNNIYNLYYTVKSQEATLEKYTISAPYDGIVTESNINPGTLVRTGQNLGEFTNTEMYEMEAFASIYEVEQLHIGDVVTLATDDVEGEFKGTIQRINQVIDPNSQTLKVYIVTTDNRLREGMYCTATINTREIKNACRVSRNLLVGEANLYKIQQDSTLKLVDINVVTGDDDDVIIQDLADGTMLLGQPMTNAYNGMKIGKMITN